MKKNPQTPEPARTTEAHEHSPHYGNFGNPTPATHTGVDSYPAEAGDMRNPNKSEGGYSRTSEYQANPASKTRRLSIWQLSLRYGGLAGSLMVGYFLLVNALGFHDNQAVRFASNLVVVGAVGLAVRAFQAQPAPPAPYLGGLWLSFRVSLMGCSIYAAFILLYANYIAPAYYDVLAGETYLGSHISPLMLALTILLLGVVVGCLTGYTLLMNVNDGPPPHAPLSDN